jgi:integrase
VAGPCGLRFSEVTGLRVGRVDAAGRGPQVLETAPQVGGDRASPKTVAGRRTVPMLGLVVELLGQHLDRYALTGDNDALVITAERGGRLNAANWHKRAWVTARANAGFPSLGSTTCATPPSRSGWRGAPTSCRCRWLGHSTVQITADVCGHLFPETNDLVIGRLDRALRDALPDRGEEQRPATQPVTDLAGTIAGTPPTSVRTEQALRASDCDLR